MEKHLRVILLKMFEVVNLSENDLDMSLEEYIKQPTWFMDKTWSSEQEEQFQKWMEEYLKVNKDAYRILTSQIYSNNKKNREKVAKEFTWNYGWRSQN